MESQRKRDIMQKGNPIGIIHAQKAARINELTALAKHEAASIEGLSKSLWTDIYVNYS